MEYLLWENDRGDDGAVIRGGMLPRVEVSFITGNLVTSFVPPSEAQMDARSQGQLTDNLVVMGGPRIFSTRLVDLLRDQGVDNLQTFPCSVRNLVTGTKASDYWMVNVVGKVSCIDRSKSELFISGGDPNDVIGFDYIVLREADALGLPFFLLAELPFQIVLSRRIADALEGAGVTGVTFKEQGRVQDHFPPIR